MFYLKSTKKLAKLYLKEGKKELAKAVIELDSALESLSNSGKHYCPSCYKEITDSLEIEFYKSTGECGTCDHVRAELPVGFVLEEVTDEIIN